MKPEWIMLLPHEGKLIPFANCFAWTAEEARQYFVTDQGRRHQSAVDRWTADGQPVRLAGKRQKIERLTATESPAP